MSELRMWAVKRPKETAGRLERGKPLKDSLVSWTLAKTRAGAIDLWLKEAPAMAQDWREWERKGYRCVRVRVMEERDV